MFRYLCYPTLSAWILCTYCLLWTVLPHSARSTSLERREEWDAWKATTGRLYGSSQEEAERYGIWLDNAMYIEEHNRNSEKLGFTLRMNTFGDMSEEEWTQTRRCHKVSSYVDNPRNVNNSFKKELYLPLVDNDDVPTSVDWREHGVVSGVKDQEEYRCHSCYAFAATGAIESATAMLTGSVVPLSEQQIIDCSRIYANAACQGGNYKFAWNYIMDIEGIQTAKSYPYISMAGSCNYNSKNASGSQVVGMQFIQKGNEEDLKIAVATIGPIAIAFNHRRRSFQFYYQGVYSDQSCTSYPARLTHEMLVIGYGVTYNDVPYWIVKNSYGKNWGHNGYMRVRRNVNMCGIATDAAAPIITISRSS